MNIILKKLNKWKINQILLTTEKIKLDKNFLDVYYNFNEYLNLLGFRVATIKRKYETEDNCIFQTNQFKSSHGVERYIHDILNLSIRFCRNHYKWICYFFNWNHFSEVIDNRNL